MGAAWFRGRLAYLQEITRRSCASPAFRMRGSPRTPAAVRSLSTGNTADDARHVSAVVAGADPESLHALGERHGYDVFVTWSATSDEHMDAVFVLGGVAGGRAVAGTYRSSVTHKDH